MRFTSLIIELIRARPRLVVWLVALFQAALWLILAMLLYRSPPGDLATVLAYRQGIPGRHLFLVRRWRSGSPISLIRAAGNHILRRLPAGAALRGRHVLRPVYQLARAIVGGQQAVLAVLLTMTVVAFGWSNGEFGPLVLARPLWALLLLHSWQIIGQNRRSAWFAWSIEAGLLLLTTSAAIGLLLLIVGFAVATPRGRRTLMSLDPLYALLVIVVLALPWLIWLLRADVLTMPPWPAIDDLSARALHWGVLLGGLIVATAGIVLLAVLNSGWFSRNAEEAPIIYRPPVEPLARQFVYCFAIAPALLGSLIAGLFDLDRVTGGPGVALLMSGLAAIVATGDLVYLRRQRLLRSVWAAAVAAPAFVAIGATLFLPWTGVNEVPTSLPARTIAHFFGENFERRTNQKLRAVTGDPQLASFIAMDAGRPHLLLDATPERTPWLSLAKFNETGGVVVWRAADTSGTPPPELMRRFPGLVPEVPRAFEWIVNGRQPLLRVGWAIVRPKGQ